jgi:uncharacterized membrane protein YphA (DoxX/SURF4 family)
MNRLNENINETFDKVSFVGPWFLRIILGVSFFLYGSGKFPLPSEMLVGFGFPNSIATLVPLVFMIFALVLAHSDWLITADLFKNIQIYLLGVSLYFVFKPKN